MQCPRCQHENPDDAAFCAGCGEPLALVCSRCGRSNAPDSSFCNGCGQPLRERAIPTAPDREPRSYTPNHLVEKILTTRSALEGERKQVTVLFADVKGSMELAEQVDAEEWHRILDRFFQILADGVHRFEGTINQYTGDGIMALFGAPIAHEDHAQRACYAALHLRDEIYRYAQELRRRHGIDFYIRFGLNSGEVVVGKIGDDLRMDYTAQGQTVGFAARIEELAEAGKPYLSESTASLVRSYFELEDLGEFRLKGIRSLARLYGLRAVGPVRTRLDLSRARGLSRFIGREEEMHALETALARAAEAKGQALGVVGEAGIGKSRLCYEFLQKCRARGIEVLEGHGVSHGRSIPYLPILQVLRQYYDITEQDSDQLAREKIAGRLLLLDDAFRDDLPLLFDFLGVPDPDRPTPRMDPEARQRQLFGIVRRLIQLPAPRRDPTVILLEDLHWIDGATETFIEALLESLPTASMLLVLNFRPEYRADWMSRSYYQQIALGTLGPEAVQELLADRLGADPSLQGLAERIHERTRGNPFFAEEVAQSLAESGALEGKRGGYRLAHPIEAIEIPPAVQTLLAARIDRLPEREKQVLQTAAVIGRTFPELVLARCADLPETDLTASLHALQAAEFIYEESLYPQVEYAFKHPLTQEVAYGSQLAERRRRIHEAVARAIEELYADRLGEGAALLAYHWEQAGDPVAAAGWSARAAEHVGYNDFDEALRHWRKVRSLLEAVPESPEALALRTAACSRIPFVAWRTGMPPEELQALFEEGRELAQRSGDRRALAILLSGYAAMRNSLGDVSTYHPYTMEALRVAETTGDEALIAALLTDPVYSLILLGRLSEAEVLAEEAVTRLEGKLDLGRDLIGYSPYLSTRWLRTWTWMVLGRIRGAVAELDRVLEIARKARDAEVLTWVPLGYVWLEEFSGTPHSAVHHMLQAVELAEKIGSPFSRAATAAFLGWAYRLNGEASRAIEWIERARALAHERRTLLESESVNLSLLADAFLQDGRAARARELAEEAIAIARRNRTPLYECGAQLVHARVLLESEGVAASDAIRSAAQHGLALVNQTGARAYEPLFREQLGRIAALLGDEASYQRELREAHRLFTEMGATGHAERVARELAS